MHRDRLFRLKQKHRHEDPDDAPRLPVLHKRGRPVEPLDDYDEDEWPGEDELTREV